MRRATDPRGKGTSGWVTAVRERQFRTPAVKLMMMVIADYIDREDLAYPGNGTLASDVGVDERTIKRALADLSAIGVVRLVPRWSHQGAGGKDNNAIQFLWEGFQQLPLVGQPVSEAKEVLRGLGDNLSRRVGGQIVGGLGDNSSWLRGHLVGGLKGHSTDPSVYRTPIIKPPVEPLVPAVPSLPDFERWYAVYPLHRDPGAARKAWPKALAKVGGDTGRLIAAAERYRDDENREAAFTKYPASWLNAESWDADPLPPRTTNGNQRMNKTDQRTLQAMEWAEREDTGT